MFHVSNPQPFDSVGLFTFLRTYARRLDESDPHSEVESWQQTLTRVVEACNSQLKCNFTQEEKQEFFDLLYNLKCSVAGRFLWQLGTKTVDKMGLTSLMNCAFTVVDTPVRPFTWIMSFLMMGSGTGFRISLDDIKKFPLVKGAVITRKDVNDADFIVPDSREGWVKLLGKVLKAHFYSGKSFSYSCHLLRSKGAPIKGFGGLSSGPEELCKGIENISSILNAKAGGYITTTDALDIANIIGRIVVSGNVRRCLPKGALVHTKDGLVPIENVKVGTLVQTFKGLQKVTNFFDQGVQKLITIETTKDKKFQCTANHKMAVCVFISSGNFAWIEAANLKPGMCLFSSDNELVQVVAVHHTGIEAETFDLEVEETHSFFCNGYLTHNSAQIALGDVADSDYLKAKRWDLGNIPNWRCYSNNSIICNDISEILENEEFWLGYQGTGEPYGLINLKLMQSCGRLGETQYADPTVEGVNPCSEQCLARWETCCLAELYLPNIQTFDELLKCIKYLYRACKHSLALPCKDSEETEKVVHENFRMGIGVTGYLQATEEQREWLKQAYPLLREFDLEYSKANGFPVSVKLSTCKPSGCSRGDSLILTNKGLQRLDELGNINGEQWQKVENTQAFIDSNRTENVSKFYVNGRVETKKILTHDGLEVESSLNHQYRILDESDTLVWRRVDELKTGDRLVVKLGGHPTDVSTRLIGAHELGCRMAGCDPCVCAMKSPEILDKDVAYFIGIFYAIGCDGGENITKFLTKSGSVKEWIKSFVSRVFHLEISEPDDGLYIDSAKLKTWFCLNKCKDKNNVPKLIRCSSYKILHSFMEGFWFGNNEGVGKFGDSWSGVISSKSLLNQLLQICRSLSYIVFAGQMEGGKFADHLEHNNMLFFMNRDIANPHRYWEDDHSNDYWLDPIVSITASQCETYDIEVENAHHYRLGGVISHNTLSLLGHCTSGVHPAFSQYYIRRIRVSSDSKLIQLAESHNYPVEYQMNFDGSTDYSTKIISFPYAFPDGTITADECTAVQQLEYVKRLQTEWSDNAVSVTVVYKLEELPEIKAWLKTNYNDSVKAVSFLLYSGHGFKQAPLEKITKEQYEKMISEVKPFTVSKVDAFINSEADENLQMEAECVGGVCPMK